MSDCHHVYMYLFNWLLILAREASFGVRIILSPARDGSRRSLVVCGWRNLLDVASFGWGQDLWRSLWYWARSARSWGATDRAANEDDYGVREQETSAEINRNMQLTAAELFEHPAYQRVIWDLRPTERSTVIVAKGRGGHIKITYEVHGSGPIQLVVK